MKALPMNLPDTQAKDGSRGQPSELRRYMAPVSAACVVAYAAFVQWFWGWDTIFAAWHDIGLGTCAAAIGLFCATYLVRCYRISDYFPTETGGRFLALFRVVQIHNLLNIMVPFRVGEVSFPVLMRSEFGVTLTRGTAALLVMRLLDLHALLAAAGVGFLLVTGQRGLVWALWALFLISPVLVLWSRAPLVKFLHRSLPGKLHRVIEQIEQGLPRDHAALLRAWLMTCLNWGTKIAVFVWILNRMGVQPLPAALGGAIGGELSSVLPFHAPAGVGTYPAGIVAGSLFLGASTTSEAMEILARASINAHLMIIVSALVAAGLASLYRPRSNKA
ncbi:hypothetical protein QO002_001783 [Pararhizobium capsulatum DSM 1112]|uniref:Lysylphosphatidylglycerol synthase TM region n=1 Tax=Pararhizobium capsulatum DSM 1112 TaxID=1121113 RepID=A0ABU0BN17_9HYPH|nr:lysylphosphatidylglycerol synthase domain-containing protein [Pararhizobium capsulatum]MDQ0319645.1 hypothetical protein [Pararhizobium capsulatum DSM 1112]